MTLSDKQQEVQIHPCHSALSGTKVLFPEDVKAFIELVEMDIIKEVEHLGLQGLDSVLIDRIRKRAGEELIE